jgi:hypothetical protein
MHILTHLGPVIGPIVLQYIPCVMYFNLVFEVHNTGLVFSFDMGIIRKEEVTQEVNNLLENKDNE